MNKKRKAAKAASLPTQRKDRESYRKIQTVRKLFLGGGKFTAVQVNELCHTNDARKIISDLRNKEGWNIMDVRLDDQRKIYWLDGGQRCNVLSGKDNKNEQHSITLSDEMMKLIKKSKLDLTKVYPEENEEEGGAE